MSTNESGDTMVEAFRRANPVPASQTEGRRSMPSAHALFADIVAERPPRVSRRLRRRVLLIAIAVALIGLLLAAFVLVRKDATDPSTDVACYAAPDLHARRILTAPLGDPRQTCARLFEEGAFAGVGIKHAPAPGFDVCSLAGAPAVFPGESGSVCKRLGLPEASVGDPKMAKATTEMDRRVSASCMPREPAVRIIESVLAKYGLKGWTIELGPSEYDSAHPCTSMGIHPGTRTIMLIPYADPRLPPRRSGP
jgi:hypothetical protein